MPTNNHSDNFNEDEAPLDDEQLWDLLSLYVDGEADPAQAAIVEQMLSSDPAYRRDFDFLMASSSTMHAIEEVEPPIGLTEAIQARTTRRPTLVGRLRAAWERATTPAFGRYATIGGAFAAAALAIVFFLPHLQSGSSHGTTPDSMVATRNTAPPAQPAVNPPSVYIPDIPLPNMSVAENTPRPPQPEHPSVPPPAKSGIASNALKSAVKDGSQVANKQPGLPKHSLQPHANSNGLQQVAYNGGGSGFSYDRTMDLDKAHNESATIGAQKEDLGTKVDETPTSSTVTPPDSGKPGPIASNGSGEKPTQTGDTPPPVEPVKPRIHVAVYPPDVAQNLKADVLRRKQSIQMDNFDHSIADAGQKRDALTLFKSTF